MELIIESDIVTRIHGLPRSCGMRVWAMSELETVRVHAMIGQATAAPERPPAAVCIVRPLV
jgi:hypothetical protein